MKETRCKNSGALLFHPGPAEKEAISIKKENKELRGRVEKLEKMVELLVNK